MPSPAVTTPGPIAPTNPRTGPRHSFKVPKLPGAAFPASHASEGAPAHAFYRLRGLVARVSLTGIKSWPSDFKTAGSHRERLPGSMTAPPPTSLRSPWTLLSSPGRTRSRRRSLVLTFHSGSSLLGDLRCRQHTHTRPAIVSEGE